MSDPTGDDSVALSDIGNALMALRRALRKHGLHAPARVELGQYEDVDRLRAIIPKEYLPLRIQHTDKPEVVASIAGIDLVVPAQRIAEAGGGYRFG